MTPKIVVTPCMLALTSALGEELRFWCNVAERASYTLAESSDEISLDIDGARAVIREVWCAGFYEVCDSTFDEAINGYFEIYGDAHTNNIGVVTNRIDATIFSGETWHHEPLGDRRRSHHLTAVTQQGSTEPVTLSMSQMMAEGVSAPSDDVLRLSLTATAQNATDGLRETCVQIVIYPVDADGNIIGLPQWVNQN